MDAVSLLERDHIKFAALFEAFEGADAMAKRAIAGEICRRLAIHSRLEQEIVYPELRDVLGAKASGMIAASLEEHVAIRQLAHAVEEASLDNARLDQCVRTLGWRLMWHIEEEEDELFAQLEEHGVDLDALGERLASRRRQLLEGEDEPAPGTPLAPSAAALESSAAARGKPRRG